MCSMVMTLKCKFLHSIDYLTLYIDCIIQNTFQFLFFPEVPITDCNYFTEHSVTYNY